MSENKTEQLLNEIQRFNESCYLMDHIKQLAATNQGAVIKEPYKNFSTIDVDPATFIQAMLSKKGAESLMNITPAQVALLVPKIQLFKVLYKNGDKKGADKELTFRDYTNTVSIDNMTKDSRGRGDDVGIKSFEYVLTGKRLVEGGIAKCKLVLFFQNARALVEAGGEVNYRDLIMFPPSEVTPNQSKCETNEYKSENYRIKVIVGWADPSDPTKAVMTDELLKAIKSTKSILYMTLIKHDIDFRENGSIELSLEYRGAIEGILSSESSDIFWLSQNGTIAKKLREEQEEKKRKLEEKQKTHASEPKAEIGLKDVKSLISSKEDGVSFNSKMNQEQSKPSVVEFLDALDKQEKYSRLVNSLFENSKIYYTDVTPKQILEFDNLTKKMIAERREKDNLTDEQVKSELIKYKEENKILSFMSGKSSRGAISVFKIDRKKEKDKQEAALKALNEANQLALNVTPEYEVSWWGIGSEKLKGINLKPISKEEIEKATSKVTFSTNNKSNPDGTKRINFIFLGDLLDAVLSVLTDKNRKDNYNMRVIVGSCYLPSIKSLINLADIPVSLDLFNNWYINKVIKPQRETYMLGDFIKDLVSELVVPLINSEGCLTSKEDSVTPEFDMTILTVPDKNNKFKPGVHIRSIDEIVIPGGTHYDIKDLAHYLYIFVKNQSFRNLNGDYNEDVKKGIYHFVIGADRGLVRSVKFSKVNVPYGKEVMATADSDQQVRHPGYYNAQVVMVGNNLFSNGAEIFIDTSKISQFENGGGNDKSIMNILRLGGYYIITKVEQHVSKDDWTTELEARWNQDINVKSKKCTNGKNTASKLTSEEKKTGTEMSLMDKVEKDKTEVMNKLSWNPFK